jgi:hypothetical protein
MEKIITNCLIEASKILEVQAKNLPEVKKFVIDCSLLKEFLTENICKSNEFKDLFAELTKISGPCVYWYKIISENTGYQIIDMFEAYKKDKSRARAIPAMKTRKKISFDSEYLYIGKVKRGFHGRVIQHLGCFTVPHTQGLQLYYWAKELKLILELNVVEFERSMEDLLPIIELTIANMHHPLIGKHK